MVIPGHYGKIHKLIFTKYRLYQTGMDHVFFHWRYSAEDSRSGRTTKALPFLWTIPGTPQKD